MRTFTGIQIGLLAFAATGAAIMVPALAPPVDTPPSAATVAEQASATPTIPSITG